MNILRGLLLIALVAFAILASSAFAEDAALKVIGLDGKVLVKIFPSEDWVDAKTGQELKAKDAIKTRENSRVMLKFSDKSTIALKSATEITVNELVWNDKAKQAGLDMPSGALRAVIDKTGGPSSFRVRTPTAICGARGTVFYVMAGPDETRVFVTEGSVDLANPLSNDTYVVIENMMAISELSGSVTRPRELTGEERDRVLAGWDGVIAETYTEPVPEKAAAEGDTINTEAASATGENPAVENKSQQDDPNSPV